MVTPRRRFAPTAITVITRTLARRMVTTALTGSWAASLSARVPGSAGEHFLDQDSVVVASMVAGFMVMDTMVAGVFTAVEALSAIVGSEVAVSTAERWAASMGAAVSMAEVADSMVAGDTAKPNPQTRRAWLAGSSLVVPANTETKQETAGSKHCQPFFYRCCPSYCGDFASALASTMADAAAIDS
jgi:hypothetical protein